MVPSLRDRRRLAVRESLTDAAFQLIEEVGYDNASVTAIAERAQVGRTTTFRHFATKDDLFLAWIDDVREALVEALRAQPASVAPFPAIRAAMSELADVYLEHRDRTAIVATLCATVPSIRARYLERKRAWEDVLANDAAARLDIDVETDLLPRLIAQAALAASSAATEHWFLGGCEQQLPLLVDDALAMLDRGLGHIGVVTPVDVPSRS